MKDGLIQQVAAPIDLYDNPQNMFVAGFIGSPPMNFFHGHIEKRDNALWFVEQPGPTGGANFSVGVALRRTDKLASNTGQPVVFGSRPEDINDRRLNPSPNTDSVVRATVDVVEPMGAEIYLYLKTARHSFISRVTSRETAAVNDQIEMVFDMNKCHFFDAKLP